MLPASLSICPVIPESSLAATLITAKAEAIAIRPWATCLVRISPSILIGPAIIESEIPNSSIEAASLVVEPLVLSRALNAMTITESAPPRARMPLASCSTLILPISLSAFAITFNARENTTIPADSLSIFFGMKRIAETMMVRPAPTPTIPLPSSSQESLAMISTP